MAFATLVQGVFYFLVLVYHVKPVQCLSSGCANGTSGSCWQVGHSMTAHNATSSFPRDCVASGVPCATCAPYTADNNQQCDVEAGWKQCEWLHGDAEDPAPIDVTFVLLAIALFMAGDAVWEGQMPAVLQTLFDAKSGQQPAAMANRKLWQSLGIGAMFGLARLNSVRMSVLVLIGALALSSTSLLWLHTRVANFDSGQRVQGGAQ